MRQRQEVRITNPLPGGQGKTSATRARRFVKKGVARFVDAGTIEFLETPERARLLKTVAKTAEEILHARVTGCNYDRLDRMLSEREMARLPMVAPARMLRKEKTDRDWSYAAATRHTIAPADSPEAVRAMREKTGLVERARRPTLLEIVQAMRGKKR